MKALEARTGDLLSASWKYECQKVDNKGPEKILTIAARVMQDTVCVMVRTNLREQIYLAYFG